MKFDKNTILYSFIFLYLAELLKLMKPKNWLNKEIEIILSLLIRMNNLTK